MRRAEERLVRSARPVPRPARARRLTRPVRPPAATLSGSGHAEIEIAPSSPTLIKRGPWRNLALYGHRQGGTSVSRPIENPPPTGVAQGEKAPTPIGRIANPGHQAIVHQPIDPTQAGRRRRSRCSGGAGHGQSLALGFGDEHVDHQIPGGVAEQAGGKLRPTGILSLQIRLEPCDQLMTFPDLRSSAIPSTIAPRHGIAHTVLSA